MKSHPILDLGIPQGPTPNSMYVPIKKSKRPHWNFNSAGIAIALKPGEVFRIIPAPQEDVQKVISFYEKSPAAGYDIRSVEVIFSPTLQTGFETYIQKMQQRSGIPVFSPKWHADNSPEIRKQVHSLYQQAAAPYPVEHYPDIKLFPAWHGTRQEIVGSIAQTGYANLALTDSGYFGKGIYTTPHAEYAGRVYTKDGTLIFNWVASFSAYPVIDGDMQMLKGKGNSGNYDAHFVPVVPASSNPNEVSFVPPKLGAQHKYIEMVVFDAAACFPRYLVRLQPTLTKSLPAPTIQKPIVKQSDNKQAMFKPAEAGYQKGLQYETQKKYLEAYDCFYAEAQKNDANAQYKVGYYRYKGLTGKPDIDGAKRYFELAAKQGHNEALSALQKISKPSADAQKPAVKQTHNNPVMFKSADTEYQKGLQYEGQKKYIEAYNCFYTDAQKNDANAQYKVGYYRYKGLTGKPDIDGAKRYFDLAAKQGHKEALSALQQLQKPQTPQAQHKK